MNPHNVCKLPSEYSSIYEKLFKVIALRGKQIRSNIQTSSVKFALHADAIREIRISAAVKVDFSRT